MPEVETGGRVPPLGIADLESARRFWASLHPRCTRAPAGYWCGKPGGHPGDCQLWPDEEPDSIATRFRAWRARHPLVVEIRNADRFPRGYGLAWERWDRCVAVCMPIPLNVLAGRARLVWLWLKRGGAPLPMVPSEAYAAGFKAGREAEQRRQRLEDVHPWGSPWH